MGPFLDLDDEEVLAADEEVQVLICQLQVQDFASCLSGKKSSKLIIELWRIY